MHALIVWGCLLSAMVTFPLVFGWIHFKLEGETGYRAYLFGFQTSVFPGGSIIGAARILGANKDLGTIEVGKLADLVVLDADPLADIRNTRRIWQVVHYGRLVDRPAILKAVKPR